MNDLDNVAVAIPIGQAEAWGAYFWYAWGPSTSKMDIFNAAPVGTWVNRGDSVYTFRDGRPGVRSPVSGVVVASDSSNLMIQPVKGYKLSESDGQMMFREVIIRIHDIEEAAENQRNMGCLGQIFTLISGRNDYSNVKKRNPEQQAKFNADLKRLAETQCTTRSLKS